MVQLYDIFKYLSKWLVILIKARKLFNEYYFQEMLLRTFETLS